MNTMDISLGLEDTHVLITGGGGLIGTHVVSAFLSAGAKVSSIDICYNPGDESTADDANPLKLHVDTTDEKALFRAFELAYLKNGPVQVCVALAALDLSALPHYTSALDMPVEQFRRTIDVNVTGTFLTARQWLRGLRFWKTEHGADAEVLRNVSLIIVGSESGHWGEVTNVDYGTSKGAVQYGMLQSLRQDAPKVYPGARVNAIAPGAVNTRKFKEECAADPRQFYADAVATTALARPVEPEDVARGILYLASERFSRSVHGQILNVDSGKLGKLVNPPEKPES